MNYSFETKVLFCRKLLRPKRQYYFMTCTDKPVCVVGNRLVTLNELFGLIIDLYLSIKVDGLKVSNWTVQKCQTGRSESIKLSVTKVLKRTV